MKYTTKEYTLHYRDDQETMEKIFNKLLSFYKEHEAFNGESICQNDAPQIAAPELLSEIAEDLFNFKIEYKG